MIPVRTTPRINIYINMYSLKKERKNHSHVPLKYTYSYAEVVLFGERKERTNDDRRSTRENGEYMRCAAQRNATAQSNSLLSIE